MTTSPDPNSPASVVMVSLVGLPAGTMTQATRGGSSAAASSSRVATGWAPKAAAAARASAFRSKATTSWPCSISRWDMLAPILPSPTIAIFMGVPPWWVGRGGGRGGDGRVGRRTGGPDGSGPAVARSASAPASAAALSFREAIRSSKLAAKEATPSVSRVAATSSMSMPASASRSMTARLPTSSASTVRATVPWSRKSADGGVGHGVDGVGTDQGVDVGEVGVGRVLGGGRRPQRALHPGPLGGQRLPPGPGEPLEEQGVGQRAWATAALPRSARRSASPSASRLDPPVDLGVDPADEERGDAGHAGEVVRPGGGQGLEAGEVGLDDLGVAGEREDEGHVDAPALGDHLADRGDALGRGRDLDQHVGPVDPLVEAAGRPSMVPSVSWARDGGHLHRDEPVAAAGRVVDRAEDAQGGRRCRRRPGPSRRPRPRRCPISDANWSS